MTAGVRHDDLRRRNRALVIEAARRGELPSRTEIAQTTGLSHSTISAISADLIAENILVQAKPAEIAAARRGRPQVALRLNPEAACVLSIVLSLNVLTVHLIDYAGTILNEETRRLDTLDLDAACLLDAVETAGARALAGRPAGAGPLMRITMAVQGITDSRARKLLWSPITPHSDIDFAARLESAFGVPASVQNDCNMIAVALHWRNPALYGGDFVAILLSNGIGMGLMLKGALFTGSHSSGGEFGHMIHVPDGALCRCGRHGCVEAYAGNYAILRNARGESERAPPMADIDEATMMALGAAARGADGPERRAFTKAGEALGFALGSLFALIDPAPVAIVGPGVAAFDVVEPAIRAAIARTAGGQHGDAIVFETDPHEMPLIREGCAMTALTALDADHFAPGLAGQTGAAVA